MVIVTRPRDHQDKFFRAASTDYSQAYTRIVKDARRGTGASGSSSGSASAAPVLLLVAADVDALCATRSLAALLSDDDVAYRICPIDGYATLQSLIEEDVAANDELRAVVLINLGSLLSLPNYFTTPANPVPDAHVLPLACSIHLIDSHRPYNLDNLFATSEIMDRIYVWDDGEIEERLGREEKAYTALEFIDDLSSDDDDDESEDDDDDQATSSSAAGSDDDDDGQGSQRAASRERPHKRRRRVDSQGNDVSPMPKTKKLPPNVLASYRNILSRYYSRGTHCGMSIASMMFLLAEKLGRSDNTTLWLAIIGLTTQYTHSQIPHLQYIELAKAFQSDVRAFNKMRTGESAQRSLGRPADADDGRIRVVEQELRFTLYRHWSLESSMYHSSYVAGKLGIWKEQGLSMLRGLMAKMGLSLAQCRQTYEHMDLELRESLISRLQSIAPEYGLVECIYPSFVRTYGYRSAPMSAGDTVDGLDALLSAAHGVRIEVDAPGLAFGSAGVGSGGLRGAYAAAIGDAAQESDLFHSKRLWSCGMGKTDAQKGIEEAPSSSTTPAWVQNFFTAYSALDCNRSNSVKLLRASLSLSKALHDVVIRQGVFVIEKQLIRTLRSFRLVIIKESPDLALLANAQILQRLGVWLVDALRDIVQVQNAAQRKKRKLVNAAGRAKGQDANDDEDDDQGPTTLPFVVAALDDAQDRYTVVGINASMQYGHVVRNNFGLLFQEAATASHARTKHDQFESSAVEVRKHDLPAFVEALHGLL